MERAFWWSQLLTTAAMKVLQQMFGFHCIEKFKGFVFMFGLLGKLWILTCVLLRYLYITQIHVFSIGQETMAVKKILN